MTGAMDDDIKLALFLEHRGHRAFA